MKKLSLFVFLFLFSFTYVSSDTCIFNNSISSCSYNVSVGSTGQVFLSANYNFIANTDPFDFVRISNYSNLVRYWYISSNRDIIIQATDAGGWPGDRDHIACLNLTGSFNCSLQTKGETDLDGFALDYPMFDSKHNLHMVGSYGPYNHPRYFYYPNNTNSSSGWTRYDNNLMYEDLTGNSKALIGSGLDSSDNFMYFYRNLSYYTVGSDIYMNWSFYAGYMTNSTYFNFYNSRHNFDHLGYNYFSCPTVFADNTNNFHLFYTDNSTLYDISLSGAKTLILNYSSLFNSNLRLGCSGRIAPSYNKRGDLFFVQSGYLDYNDESSYFLMVHKKINNTWSYDFYNLSSYGFIQLPSEIQISPNENDGSYHLTFTGLTSDGFVYYTSYYIGQRSAYAITPLHTGTSVTFPGSIRHSWRQYYNDNFAEPKVLFKTNNTLYLTTLSYFFPNSSISALNLSSNGESLLNYTGNLSNGITLNLFDWLRSKCGPSPSNCVIPFNISVSGIGTVYHNLDIQYPSYFGSMISIPSLVDQILSGASLTEVLEYYNPSMYKVLAQDFKNLFDFSEPSLFPKHLLRVIISFVKYVARQPASLVVDGGINNV